MIKVTLKDGSVKEYEAGISVLDVAKDLSEGLARNACAGSVNGKTVDLRFELKEECYNEKLHFWIWTIFNRSSEIK